MLLLLSFSTLVFNSSVSFAQDAASECANLRFEAQNFICTLEANESSDAAGASAFKEAIKRKVNCQNSFLKLCQSEIAGGVQNGVCELIKFEAQDLICNLEASASSDAAGTVDFQSALKKKLNCQNAFLKICHSELRD